MIFYKISALEVAELVTKSSINHEARIGKDDNCNMYYVDDLLLSLDGRIMINKYALYQMEETEEDAELTEYVAGSDLIEAKFEYDEKESSFLEIETLASYNDESNNDEEGTIFSIESDEKDPIGHDDATPLEEESAVAEYDQEILVNEQESNDVYDEDDRDELSDIDDLFFGSETSFEDLIKKIGYGKYECRQCGYISENNTLLRKHIQKHLPRSMCTLCGKLFKTVIALGIHEKVCNPESNSVLNEGRPQIDQVPGRARICEYCLKENFRSGVEYGDHVNIHTGEKPYECSCGGKFRHSGNYLDHLKKFKCSLEKVIYPVYAESLMKKRLEILTRVCLSENIPIVLPDSLKECLCPVCGKKDFKILVEYGDHLTAHMTSEKMYTCSCGKKSRNYFSLNLHRHLNFCAIEGCLYPDYAKTTMEEAKLKKSTPRPTGQTLRFRRRGFECEHCKAVFPVATARDNHINMNHLDKKLSCPECDKQFESELQLNKHKKFHYEFSKCEICGILKLKKEMDLHMQTHGTKRMSCEECDFSAKSQSALTDHMKKSHPDAFRLKCEKCDFIAETKGHLNLHDQIMHEWQSKSGYEVCPICTKSIMDNQNVIENHFSALKHQIAETKWKNKNGISSYFCPQCRKKFGKSSEIMKHMKNFHKSVKTTAICVLLRSHHTESNDITSDITEHAGEDTEMLDELESDEDFNFIEDEIYLHENDYSMSDS